MIQVFISRNMPLRRKEGREGGRKEGRKKKNCLTNKMSRFLYALNLTNWQESDLPFKKLLDNRNSTQVVISSKSDCLSVQKAAALSVIVYKTQTAACTIVWWSEPRVLWKHRSRRAGLCEECEDSHEVKNEGLSLEKLTLQIPPTLHFSRVLALEQM